MMRRGQKRGCKRERRYFDKVSRPLSKPFNFYAEKGITTFDPDHPILKMQTYTSEQDFIEKRTELIAQFDRPVFVTGVGGGRRLLYTRGRTVTSDTWKRYQENQKRHEEFRRLVEKACIDSPVSSDDDLSDSESLPYDPIDASAAGLSHPLLEEKPELQVLSSAPLDALDDVTHNTNTVTEPVVVGLPCDPDLDIPAAGFNNTLLDTQLPEITAPPFRELVLEGSSFDPHGEDESLPYDPFNHPLLEEKAELGEVLSSAPLDALDATEKAATVTEPVVEGLPCDPDLDIPAAGFNNSLPDSQVPENTASPVEDLVAESLLADKHDVGPEGELVVEGSSFDPRGEDERLRKVAKKKAHQKMLDKKKRKSIVLSPGRLSMKKMKMGRNLDGFSQDNMVVAMFKSVIEEMSSMKKEVKTLKREFKSYKNK